MGDRATCGWNCGDDEPGHKHFAVSVRENGKLLGRLTPEGGTTKRNIFAVIFSKAHATYVASEINAAGIFTAKVVPF